MTHDTVKRIIRSIRQSLRRQRQHYFPDLQTRRYRAWISRHVRLRSEIYRGPVPSGLLSILTAVWDGSPVVYLNALATSIESQNIDGVCEWIVLDNGCTRRDVLECLGALGQRSWIKIHRSEQNLGILGGLRLCLERASNHYVLPVDGDDQLYPDALNVVAEHVQETGYPPILYTDEDKISEGGASQPYFKPDWDPVLLGNLAYIAHLGIVDREEALRLGAYCDPATEGSPDWDLFLRFAAAGHTAVHIPEVVYSWRMHSTSTAENAQSKSYITRSQQAVVAKFLQARGMEEKFSIENSPFFPGAPHWHFVRKQVDAKPITCLLLTAGVNSDEEAELSEGGSVVSSVKVDLHSDPHLLVSVVKELAGRKELLCFLSDDLAIDDGRWAWEAQGLLELYPNAAMIGGRIRNRAGEILEAGLQLGYSGVCGSPDRGRKEADPGYFGQVWKQRSVGAVSVKFAVLRPDFLLEALECLPPGASLPFLGAWLGAHALRKRYRVVYTPFLGGVSMSDWEKLVGHEEKRLFSALNSDVLPDRRFYPAPLSLQRGYILDSTELKLRNQP